MKLNCQYEDGKAFYEVTEKEEATEGDLLYYKKVLRPKKEEVCVISQLLLYDGNSILAMQLNCEELKLESFTEYFYAIPGVPSMAIKPEQLRLEHHKIFIQSTSQGSRCLKMGAKILYLREVL